MDTVFACHSDDARRAEFDVASDARDADRYRFLRERASPNQLRELAAMVDDQRSEAAQIDDVVDAMIAIDLLRRPVRRP